MVRRPGLVLTILAAALLADGPADGKDLVVTGPGGSGYPTISGALSVARYGDTVVVRPGTYEEVLVVPEGVTLCGDDPARCRVEWAGEGPCVRSAGDRAVLQDLTFAYTGEYWPSGTVGARHAQILVEGGDLTVRSCRVLGGKLTGVRVAGGRAEIRDSLLAGQRQCGVLVDGGAEARVVSSTIRNQGYAGIRIAPGGRATVTACRIAGASFHGMRWDSEADPLVTGCAFLGNVRSGVYLGSEAKGTIRGNLFHDTHLGAILCFQRAAPVIVGNTFVGSRREAIYVSEAASPVIRDNVFLENQTAITRPTGGSPQGWSDDVRVVGEPVIENNCLWGNGTEYLCFPEDPDTVRADPGLVDPTSGDWRLAPDSPLRGRGDLVPDIGLADLDGLPAPLPVTPEEERSMAVDGDKVDRRPPDPKATAGIEGRILDQKGQPFGGFPFAFRWGEEFHCASVGPDGRFRLLRAPAGDFTAELSGGVKVSGTTKSGETLVLPDIVVPRPETHFVEGTVTDGRGGAVPGAYVRGVGYPPWSRTVSANEDGAFSLPVPGEGRGTVFTITRFLEKSPLLVFHARAGVPTGATGVWLFRGREKVVIAVTDRRGRPVRELWLALWGEAEAGGEVALAHLERSRWVSFTEWPARIDAPAEGPALTVPVPPGTYDLVAWRRGRRWPPRAVAHRSGIVVKAPDPTAKEPPAPTRLDLVMERPGRIAGRVVTRDGEPVPCPLVRSAEVRARPGLLSTFGARARGDLYVTMGDEQGRFSLDVVAPGERRLRIQADGFAPGTAVVRVEAGKRAEVAIALDRK